MEHIESLGVGKRLINDLFFDEGDEVCGMYKRVGIIDEDDEDLCHVLVKSFKCDAPNCTMEFDNLLKYDLHYNSCHRYSCSECRKQLPSPHLLDLHVSETHDSFFKTLSERKPMFRCFIEDCHTLMSDPKQRKAHCIEVHNFPHDFKYDSSRKSGKKKNERKKETLESQKSKCTANAPVHHGSFTFGGKKTGKTFNTSKEKKGKAFEMDELREALPEKMEISEESKVAA